MSETTSETPTTPTETAPVSPATGAGPAGVDAGGASGAAVAAGEGGTPPTESSLDGPAVGDAGPQGRDEKALRHRISTLGNQKAAAEERARLAEAELQAIRARYETPKGDVASAGAPAQIQLPPTGFVPQADVERRAAEIAKQQTFLAQCNEIHQKGVGQFPDFQAALANYTMLGGLKPEMVEAALETDAPERVLYELGKDLNEAQRIMDLPPARQGAAIAKFAAARLAKSVSKAPAPVRPVVGAGSGNGGAVDLSDENTPIDVWMAQREADIAKRRANGKVRH